MIRRSLARSTPTEDPEAAFDQKLEKRTLWSRLTSDRLGRIALYGSSRSVLQGLLAMRGMVLAGMLGPQLFGVWALFRLALTYGAFLGLGLLRGLEIEVAKARDEKQDEIREAWARTAAGFTLAVFGGTALMLAAAGGLADERWLRELLWAIAAGLLLERLYFYGITFLRVSRSLRSFAILELVQGVAQIFLVLALGWLFGLEGAFVGFAAANVAVLMLLARRVPFRPALDRQRVRGMIGAGVPLSMTLLLNTLLGTADRLILGAFFGFEALGQYAFAVSVASLSTTAALTVRTVVVTDVYGQLGREPASEITRAHLEDTIRPFVLVLAPLLGAIILILGPLVALALPQYAASLPAASVFVFTGVAQGTASLAVLGVVAAGQQSVLPAFSAAALLLNVGLAFGALELELGLLGLASGALLGRLAYTSGVVALAAQAANRAAARTALSLLWPILWCALVLALMNLWRSPSDASTLVQALALYATGTTPVVLVLVSAIRQRRRVRSTPTGA